MKRRKALSLLLILTILLSLVVPATSALADDDTSGGNGDKTKGMSISKTASYDEKTQKYTITLEAFATGEKITSAVTTETPTDVILVLDQSGSMTSDIGTVSFNAYTGNQTQNSSLYDNRHNGGNSNLWYKLADGTYVSVSVTTQEKIVHSEITNGRNNDSGDRWNRYTNLYENRLNLRAKVNGEFVPVTVEYTGYTSYYRTFTYSLSDGTVIATSRGDSSTPTNITNTDDGKLYLAAIDDTQTVYTYTYTDSAGEQTIGTSTGANTRFTDATLYRRTTSTTGGGSRLAAIQNAVTEFANAVTAKAKGADGEYGTKDDINHRIAVVGFAGCQYNSPSYVNTEIFIGATEYGYGQSASGVYATAFQEMNTAQGRANVLASASALSAQGSTYVDKGIDLANGIFNSNPVGANEKRNRVVIIFTDGAPGWSGSYNGYEYGSSYGDAAAAADAALTAIATTKNTHKATVYTVGIFSGADGTTAGSNADDASVAQRANWLMQNLSSNNGKVSSPSYYLSAGDMGTLSSIFQQISGNIESGGSSTTLGSETVVKDIISPYFKLPEGTKLTDIRIDTYDCTGKTGDTYSWNSTSGGTGGATADISTDGQVNVTGFNFSENWCGLDNGAAHGKKLVISFEVEPKSGFLGGNSVDTNGGAYIYENGEANTPLMEFEKPVVDVEIPGVTVTAKEKNVYLLGSVTADQLKDGAEIKVGDVTLDLTKPNYGLESWQTQYVDIKVEVTDKNGSVITDLTDLTDDTTDYQVKVTVSPKPDKPSSGIGPKVEEKTGIGESKINVFKPVLTYKDSEAYYGDVAPTDYSGNLESEVWKHGKTLSTQVTMIDTAPELTKEYTPEAGKISTDNKINTKQDIGVDVTVKINNKDVTGHVKFEHTNCTGKTCNLPEGKGKEFLIHVKTCTLTITKTGGAAGDPYVFEVKKDGQPYTEVTVKSGESVEIVELPVGTYTITEKTDWSWRYTPSYSNDGKAELAASAPNGEIICTNTSKTDKWLNDYAVKSNTYQTGTPATDSNN